MTTPVNPDQIRVSVEMGDDYQPSARLRAALDELAVALAESDESEVAGFAGGLGMPGFRTLSFDLASGGLAGGTIRTDGRPDPKSVFKY